MYGIFTYFWAIYGVNGGKYSIHGAYGYGEYTTSGSGQLGIRMRYIPGDQLAMCHIQLGRNIWLCVITH